MSYYNGNVQMYQVMIAFFPDIYYYDEDYNELRSKRKLNIMDYDYPKRRFLYDNYKYVNDLSDTRLTQREVEEVMDKDPEVKFIRNFTTQQDIYNKNFEVKHFNHLTKDDYNYLLLDEERHRDHTMLNYITCYNSKVLSQDQFTPEWNINYFIEKNIWPKNNKFDKSLLCQVIDYDKLNFLVKNNIIGNGYIGQVIYRFLTEGKELFDICKKLNIYSDYQTPEMTTAINNYIKYLESKNKKKDEKKNEKKDEKETKIILLNDVSIIKYSYNESLNFVNKYINSYKDNKETFIYKCAVDKEYFYNFINIIIDCEKLPEEKLNDSLNRKLKKLMEILININLPIDNMALYDKCDMKELYVDMMINNKLPIKSEILNTDEKLLNKLNINNSFLKLLDTDIFNLKYYTENIVLIYMENIIYFYITNDKIEYLLSKISDKNKDKFWIKIIYKLLSNDNITKEKFFKIFDIRRNTTEINLREKTDENNHTIAYYYIKKFREEPQLDFYPSPMTENLGGLWRSLFSVESPMEMTNLRYWEYMIKNSGIRRPTDITALYSYFSNSTENKLIFINNDNTLDDPAILRYIIPVPFEQVKEFLTEEIETNNICFFTNIHDKDWKKIARDNDRLDVVAFSDIKNIYKERTPVKKLINFFKDALELQFDCKLTSHEEYLL